DRRWWIAAEDAAARVVETHPVLRHLLEGHAHREGIEAAAAVLLGGAQRPQARGFRLGRNALAIVIGQLRRVGVDTLLDGNDLVAHDSTDLLAQRQELVRHPEAGELHRFMRCRRDSAPAGLPRTALDSDRAIGRRAPLREPRVDAADDVHVGPGQTLRDGPDLAVAEREL